MQPKSDGLSGPVDEAYSNELRAAAERTRERIAKLLNR